VKAICVECRRTYPKQRGRSRCAECQRRWETERNASRPQYGPGWAKLSRETIEAEPWCHWLGGCAYQDSGTSANPLTCDHVVPVVLGGAMWDRSNLTVLCRRHNSEKRDRVL
jgi:hypothetical protein